jgi:hypothetical protein
VANSIPIAPDPITASDDGGSAGDQIASLFVQYGPSANPSIGGTTGSLPVASTIRSASKRLPSEASSSRGPTRRTSSITTLTPISSNGFGPSPDWAEMMRRTRSMTAPKSISTDGTRTPNRPASRAEAATRELASMALVGTQP